MSAFWRLSATRPQGMDGPTRIPLTEVAAYAGLHQFSRTQSLELLSYIEALDAAYLGFLREQKEEEEGKRATKTAPVPTSRRPPTAPPPIPSHAPPPRR